MKYILYLALFVTFAGTSCVTQRKCLSKFPPSRDTIIITNVRDSIVLRDTVIFVTIPGETVYDSVMIPCPEVPGYIPRKVYAETSLAKASAWWSYPVIKLELIQKDTTIERRLNNAIREAYHWKTEYEKITITPQPIEVIPQRFKNYRNIVFLIFALAFGFFGWKLYRFFKK